MKRSSIKRKKVSGLQERGLAKEDIKRQISKEIIDWSKEYKTTQKIKEAEEVPLNSQPAVGVEETQGAATGDGKGSTTRDLPQEI